jgi:putative transposase
MARGFVDLVAIIDWASRRVLSWRLSATLTTDFCVAALEEELDRYGCREVFNTDQGGQFASAEFLNVRRRRQITIIMEGRSCWRDNVFVERLWRSVKYEDVYLHGYATVSDVRTGLTRYFQFFNQRRPHQALARRTRTRCTAPHCQNHSRLHLAPFHLSQPPNQSQFSSPPLPSV